MLIRLSRWSLTFATTAVVCLSLPAVAGAVPSGASFYCRASVARIALAGGLPVIEPFVANKAGTPCTDDSAGVLSPTTIGPLTANVVNAATAQKPATLGTADLADGDGAGSSATITNPTVTLGTLVVHADVIDASTAYSCQNGNEVASSAGHVVNLTINGNAITVPPGINQTISLGPLGTLVLNQVLTSPGMIVRRAVALATPLGNVVLSEAITGISGHPCAVSSTTTTPTGTKPSHGKKPGNGKKTVHGSARLVVSPRAAARLIASGGCVRSFTATVVGKRISRVVFSLDGRRVAQRTHSPFRVTLSPSSGRHLLLARVTFVRASRTRARVLSLHFTGCSAPPAFTG